MKTSMKKRGGGLKLLAPVIAFIAIISAAFSPVTASADVIWSNVYSCGSAPINATSCGGSGWSCRWDHDGTYGTSVDANGVEHTKNYHFYFCTWSGGSGGSGGGTTTPTYYYARLNYDANKGTGAPTQTSYSSTSYGVAHTFTVSSTKPTRTGYKFLGWATSASATTAKYGTTTGLTKTISVNTGSTVTLYAVWKKDGAKPTITAPAQTITLEQAKTWKPTDGVTANDKEDGDLTGKIKVTPAKPANMTTTVGKYTFKYTVTDSDGNTVTASRVITVIQNQLTSMPSTGSDLQVIIALAAFVVLTSGLVMVSHRAA